MKLVIAMMPTNEYVEIRNGGYYVAGTRIGLDVVVYILEIGVKDPLTPNLISHDHNPSILQQVATLRGSSTSGGEIRTPHLPATRIKPPPDA